MNQQACLYQPIFDFSSPEFKPNKLIDKMLPAVEVDTITNTIKCKDGDAQVAIVRAQHPLPINGLVAFFEVEVIKFSPGHSNDIGLNIGLITKDGNPRAYAGKYMNSIGYVNGQIFLSKKKISSVPHIGKKDRMGCGINCSNGSFFFTKNLQIIAKNITLPEGSKWNQFFPAIALQHHQETVKCYFEKKEFLFDIQKLGNQIQQQITAEIFNEQSQEEINSSQIYSLISEYMLFNGYSKTYQMMKQKKNEIQFKPVNKLTKNIPGTNVLINLDDQKNKIKGEIQQETNKRITQKLSQGEQIKIQKTIPQQSKLKSRYRQRIMSEVQPDIIQEDSMMIEEENEPRRKNTQIGQQFISLEYSMRKQSNVSNVSLIDDDQIHQNILEQKANFPNHINNFSKNSDNVLQQILSLNEKFLLNQRLQILSFIKEKKIECAEKIIKEKIPKIYELEPLLQPYMKAHIFLRKIIQQDQNSAISYGRTEEKFAKNIEKLFPTYDIETGSIEMIPMKKILTSIVAGKNKEHKFLKKQQFEYFAQYVNSLIMKCMGVMGNSRLGVILEHTSIILRRLQEFKGMSCGIKLLN